MRPSALWSFLGLVTLPAVTAAIEITDITRRTLDGLAKRTVLSDILSDIESLTDCSSCEALLVVLQVLAHTGNDNFTGVIIDVCEALGVEDDDVCAGAIGLEGPILAHDLREMTIGTKTSQLFCLTIFGLCQWPAVDTSYSVGMTAKPAKSRPSPSGKTPLKVVHISDIHVDLSYEAGASYNCTKNICCRPYTTADEPGNTTYPAGPYGNHACDSPLTLEESLYAAVESLVPDRTFTIFTGDVVEGAVWSITDTEVGNDFNDAYGRMKSLGQTYAVTGNHDTCPVNSFPPAAVDTTISTQWAYNNLSSDWQSWIGSAAAAEVASNYGSYSHVDKTGVKIISVNTNFWYKQNFWMYEATLEHDPSGMLSWLVSELEAAESAGQRVWILGHMPMGSSDAFHDQSYYFDQIIQRFDATVAAVFYGHTHKDEFEIAYSDYTDQTASTATMMSYIAPALTPTSGNPTFRVYDVDPVTFGILDYAVYFANLSSPTYQSGPTWGFLYSAKATYGKLIGVTDPSAELTPAFWHNVTVLFENDDAVFQTYYNLKTRDFPPESSCSGSCKTSEICQLRAAQAQYNCVTVSPGINFRRDTSASDAAAAAGECEGSAAAPIVAALASSAGLQALRTALVHQLGDAFLSTVVPANCTVNGTEV